MADDLTPLERAAAEGNRGLVQKLMGEGAYKYIGDALHGAAYCGQDGVVSDLLEMGVFIDARVSDGRTPLHAAAKVGETEVVRLLLLKGADKDAKDNELQTPLFLAVLYGHVPAALALVAAGADVSLRYGSNASVVHWAARGDVDIIRAAIERGADVDAADAAQKTPLHWAALENQAEAIDVLVEAGASIEARNGDGCTPLNLAADKPSLEAILALLKHGVDVNAQDNYQRTPLYWAAYNAGPQQPGAAEAVDLLLRSGADETIPNEQALTAADVVGMNVVQEDDMIEDVQRVRELLANAPADRAWRRRGYPVLCRTHPDRMRQVRDGGDWAVAMERVLALQEEGIFRTIVGYL